MAPVIVIMPFGNWIANENQFGDNSWASIFLRDLMPLVEGEYPQARASDVDRARPSA
jgi:hypothetical protein